MATSSGFELSLGCAPSGDAPRSHRRIHMAIEITSDSPSFFVVTDSLLPTNIK
jgi:hypothetical protein